MLDYEYALFTAEDPIKLLKDAGSELSIPKKIKYASHIRRAEVLVKKSKKFRDIMNRSKNPVYEVIRTTFTSYFGRKLDKGIYFAIPTNITDEYIGYLEAFCKGFVASDKYMESLIKVILYHSDDIDAFVKAFLSIRLAQGELDKLKSN